MHQADVYRALYGGPVPGEETLRRLRLRKAKTVHHDRQVSALAGDLDGVGPSAEQMHAFRKDELLGDLRQRIVIASNDEDFDACGMQTAKLLGEKTRRLHRGLLAVVEVAGEQECVHLLIETQVDDTHKHLPAGVADELGEPRIAQSERAQR